jgi:hypothetical protein
MTPSCSSTGASGPSEHVTLMDTGSEGSWTFGVPCSEIGLDWIGLDNTLQPTHRARQAAM